MKLKKEFITISLIMFTEIIGWSLILPFLPYFAKDLGATAFQTGLILSSFSFFQFFSAPIIGKLSDKFGRKKLLILSQFSTFLGFLILGFANSIWMLFLSRIVDGLLGSNMTLSRAYIADITEGKNRAKTFGYLGAIFSVGFFIGPAIGGFLAAINYSIPSFIAAGISLLTIILTILFLKETVKKKKGVKIKIDDFFPIKSLVKGLKRKDLSPLFIEFFLFVVGFTLLTSNLALIVDAQLGFGPEDVGLLLMLVGVSRIIFQVLALPKLLDKFSESILALIGLSFNTLAMFSIFFVSNRVGLYGSMVLFSVGAGLTRPMITTNISNKAKPDERGKIMGIMDSFASIAQIIGPLIGGYIINNYYSGNVGLLAGCVLLIALGLELNNLIQCRKEMKKPC